MKSTCALAAASEEIIMVGRLVQEKIDIMIGIVWDIV